MKVDGLGVVLAIILLPIILVVSYYIQLQVDTIATENSYDTSLLNATYDAMYAFEINTANEELSSVADSLRSIILASNNVLLNSLATNLGISNASKEHLQPYIPAVLYTLYDGYYIYAPTETPVVARDTDTSSADGLVKSGDYLKYDGSNEGDIDGFNKENTVYGDVLYENDTSKGGQAGKLYTVNKEHAKTKTDYVLKSYVQYSARYAKNNIDITINYTLDNYLNIVGTINDVYYTKTGYLIKDGLVSEVSINGTPYDLRKNNEDEAKEKILGKKTNADETTINMAESASVKINNDQEINVNWDNIKNPVKNMYNVDIKTISEAETYLKRAYDEKQDSNLVEIQNLEYEIGKYKAIAYYVSSAIFSNWVYDNLENLEYTDIKDEAMSGYYNGKNYTSTSGVNDLYYNFKGNATQIFNRAEDPEDTESAFNTHKMEVIKNSIKYNLNLSMSAYCKMQSVNDEKKSVAYDFALPVLLDEEWDKILNNISIVTFMQGWDCGLNIYNNYEMVSSTNNELMVTPSEIYYVEKDKFNDKSAYYHRIDCDKREMTNTDFISFKSKEVKYDRIPDSSTGQDKYDHKNLACYTCINTNNYDSLFKPKTDSWYKDNGKKYTSYYDRIASLTDSNLKRAGYIGLAKERQNTYKTNALPVSEGYQVIEPSPSNPEANDKTILASGNYSNIKKIQITFASTTSKNTSGNREPVLKLKAKFNNSLTRDINLNLDQTKEQTVTVDVSDINDITKIELSKQAPGYSVSYEVRSIKAIYK